MTYNHWHIRLTMWPIKHDLLLCKSESAVIKNTHVNLVQLEQMCCDFGNQDIIQPLNE